MKPLRFDWDTARAVANRRKHGVAFSEAQTVFLDDEALLLADPEHSDLEDRFILLGHRGNVWVDLERFLVTAQAACR